MKDLYEKLCLICGELLCHSAKIKWVSAPKFADGEIIISVKDINENKIDLAIPHSILCKIHDHSLENYIFKLASENDLL